MDTIKSMKFELEDSLRGVTDEELLEDMRRSAKAIGRDTITIAEYGNRKAHRYYSAKIRIVV